MTESKKAYTAPRVEVLDVRSTHDVDIHVGLPGPDINISIGLLS